MPTLLAQHPDKAFICFVKASVGGRVETHKQATSNVHNIYGDAGCTQHVQCLLDNAPIAANQPRLAKQYRLAQHVSPDRDGSASAETSGQSQLSSQPSSKRHRQLPQCNTAPTVGMSRQPQAQPTIAEPASLEWYHAVLSTQMAAYCLQLTASDWALPDYDVKAQRVAFTRPVQVRTSVAALSN